MEHIVSPVVRILLLIKAVFCIPDSFVVDLLSITGLLLFNCDVVQLKILIELEIGPMPNVMAALQI